jgi:hypothetical protein
MHATYLFVLAPRDAELDVHTGVVLHAMATIDKQRTTVLCMLDETTRFCEELLQVASEGKIRAFLPAHGASGHPLTGQALPIR